MSLNTLIEIGGKLKASKTGIRNHRFIRPCPIDNDKIKVLRLNIPVQITDQSVKFNFDSKKFGVIQQESLTGNEGGNSKLLFLRYKTSDKDNSTTKFFFGDIFYSIVSGKEADKNYSTVLKKGKDSLEYGRQIKEQIEEFENGAQSTIVKFYATFESMKERIIALLNYNEGITYFLSLHSEER